MSESTLSLTYDLLRISVADFLGFGRTIANWDTEQTAQVEESVQSGYRQFLNPPPLAKEDPAHVWSFTQPVDAVSILAGQTLKTLPDHFGGLIGEPTYPAVGGSKTQKLAVVTEAQIRSELARNSTKGPPEYCAVRVTQGNGRVPTRWELLLYPTPDAAYPITFQYNRLPDSLSETQPWPMGGQAFCEVLLESCLAVAEERFDDGVTQHHRARFMQLLADAVRLDQRAAQTSASGPWPVTPPPTGLGIHYRDLLSEVGRFLEFSWDPNTWTHEQFNLADTVVQQGMHQFYFPNIQPSYEWTFLRPEFALQTVAGQAAYPAPKGFAHLLGDLYYQNPTLGYGAIAEASLALVRDAQSRVTANATPSVVAIAPAAQFLDGKTEAAYALVFFPTPDNTYQITGRMKCVPPRLSDDNPHPLGGAEHAETIRASVLKKAETRHFQFKPPMPMGRGRRVWVFKPQSDDFQDRLAASIALDSRRQPRNLGYNGANPRSRNRIFANIPLVTVQGYPGPYS